MPNKRKICTENLNPNQSIYIPSLNSYYPPESVINSAYRKVLDFKENAEKILEKEKSETLSLNDFSKAILESRSFEISLQHNCIKLKCYITLEKDKDAKKKRNDQLNNLSPPCTPSYDQIYHTRNESTSSSNALNNDQDSNLLSPVSSYAKSNSSTPQIVNSGGAKKVNVEVIMKSNPFRIEENEKTTRMELIRSSYGENNGGLLRFTYYVRPECEAKKFRETCTDPFDQNKLIVFTNDFFTVYQNSVTCEMNISLNEIVQTQEEQRRTEALGEKLFTLLKDRPRHRALLTNECKLNHSMSAQSIASTPTSQQNESNEQSHAASDAQSQQFSLTNQEDETYYTRELIHIYGQPIVPSFHKYFNYQLSNTHYGYRTLRRLLNCDILKKYVKITKEEIKSLDRVVEFVQLTDEKCLSALQLNLTTFYDPIRFENGIVKNWLDVWYVDRLKEKYSFNESSINRDLLCSSTSSPSIAGTNSSSGYGSSQQLSYSLPPHLTNSSWSLSTQLASSTSCFLQTNNFDHEDTECDQANHLWFCLKDYMCSKMEDLIFKLKDYIQIRNNKSELILVHTAYPIFEYKDVISESRRILAMFLNKSTSTKALDEIISKNFPIVAKEHIEYLLLKFLNFDEEKRIVGFTALFEILMILKRELSKEKNDEMKYSHFLSTLERSNQDKLKMAIVQLKCVPCLNKFTTNFNLLNSSQSSNSLNQTSSLSSSIGNKNMVTHANMSRLLKQMSLIVSTELQQIAIDLVEKIDDDKPVKFIKLKDEFKNVNSIQQQQQQQKIQQQTVQIQSENSSSSSLSTNLSKSSSSSSILCNNNNSNSSNMNLNTGITNGSLNLKQQQQQRQQQQQQINDRQIRSLTTNFNKQMEISSTSSSSSSTSIQSSSQSPTSITQTRALSNNNTSNTTNLQQSRLPIFNPHNNLMQFLSADQKVQDLSAFSSTSIDRSTANNLSIYSVRF